jgi:hypothetical protein
MTNFFPGVFFFLAAMSVYAGSFPARAQDGARPGGDERAWCLELRAEDGRVVFSDNMAPGERFVLRHIHSVHKTPVRETLGLGPGNSVAILEGRYADFGAGLPERGERDQAFSFADGEAVLTLARRSVPEIEIRVGRFAEHTLFVKERAYPLALWVRPGECVVLAARGGGCNPRAP